MMLLSTTFTLFAAIILLSHGQAAQWGHGCYSSSLKKGPEASLSNYLTPKSSSVAQYLHHDVPRIESIYAHYRIMSQSQDPGERATVHDTPSAVANTPETCTAPQEAESRLPNLSWTLPEGLLQEELEKRKTRFTNDEKARAWKEVSKVVQRYSDEQIKRWNAEIDTYLVFAGLFSAVLTAFNVQSYILLQPATPDPTLLALQQISLQLSSFSTGPPPAFVNSTHPPFQQGDSSSPPVPRWAVWLNTLWFTSLILSLSSASIGIMVKQWLNEYTSGISSESESEAGISRQTARLRQYRLNNLIEWHVGDIVNSIPVLLQVSLALFLAGLLVLLWTLHPTVATISSVFAGLLGAFTLATVVLPSIKPGCAYLSPQSLAVYHMLRRGPSVVKIHLQLTLRPLALSLLNHPWMLRTPFRNLIRVLSVENSVKASTWRGTEKSIVSKESQSLDADIISTAYDTAMNPDLILTAAVCLSELDANIYVINCIDRLQQIDEDHFGAISPSPSLCAVVHATGPVIYDLWADSLLCHTTPEVQQVLSHRIGSHPIIDLDNRLSHHFESTEEPLRGLSPDATQRVLLGLSLAACHVDEILTDPKLYHRLLYSTRLILEKYNRSKVSPMYVTYAALTAYNPVLGRPLDIGDIPRCSAYLAAANVILEYVLASQGAVQSYHQAILPYANDVLLRITDAMRLASEDGEDLAEVDGLLWGFYIHHLSNLVNIVTEEPAFPLHTLFPEDRIVALERAIAAARHAISHLGLAMFESLITNRAGHKESFEDKLVRLRAIRSGSRSSPQEITPPGTNVSATLPSTFVSADSEPLVTSVPPERPLSLPAETVVPVPVEPHASIGDRGSTFIPTPDPSSHALVLVERPGLPTPRPTSYHSVPNGDLHASPGSVHGGTTVSASVLVEPSTASVPVELPGSVPAAPPTPEPASESEPPAFVSAGRPASPRPSSHHSVSTLTAAV
ncbi:hypothetical protein VTO73DRAFT_8946 [Trametes versicolor]